MQEVYRSDYDGEFVITGVKITNGRKHQEREFIENPININSISGRAVCVSIGDSSTKFKLDRLMLYHGLLNSLPLNVYTTGSLYHQIKGNFHVTFDPLKLQELIDLNLTEDIIVYTSTTNCLKTPGEFFIIPHGFKSTEEAVAAYLAAFDGHNDVFLVGYDEYDVTGTQRRSKMIDTVGNVIKTYSTTKFHHVIDQGVTPNEWRQYSNVKTMTVRDFISHCDIS